MKACCKVFIVILIIVSILCSQTFGTFAAFDSTEWDDASLHILLEAYDVSNSDLCFAAIKVKYDYRINRIYILFLLEFDGFNDDMLSGAVMNINGYGNVKIMADGTTEFNPEVYYAQLDAEYADSRSNNIIMETTLGIKNGIPDNVNMDVNIIDTYGVRSNTFHVDITEAEDSGGEPDNGGDDGDNDRKTSKSKTTKQKTTKVKTTKKKTTKVKTTKVKTTKVKTTKVKTSKSRKTASNGESAAEEEVEQIIIDAGIDDGVEVNNNRKRLTIAFCAVATLVAVASGCAVGINGRKKRKK